MVLIARIKCFNWPCKLAKLLSLMLVLEIASLDAEIIPASRRIDWSVGKTVGVPGGVPKRATIGKNAVTGYGADPTAVADSTAAIQNAINNTPSGQVAYVPPGTYRISGSIT